MNTLQLQHIIARKTHRLISPLYFPSRKRCFLSKFKLKYVRHDIRFYFLFALCIFDRSIFATKGMSIFFRTNVFPYSVILIPQSSNFFRELDQHFSSGYTPFQRRSILGLLGFLLSLRSRSHFELVSVKIAFNFVAASCRRNVQSLQERCSLSFSRCSESHEFKPL